MSFPSATDKSLQRVAISFSKAELLPAHAAIVVVKVPVAASQSSRSPLNCMAMRAWRSACTFASATIFRYSASPSWIMSWASFRSGPPPPNIL